MGRGDPWSVLPLRRRAVSAPGSGGVIRPDLTWEGYAVCEELKDGKFTHDTFPDPLEISHSGDKIRISGFGILYEGMTQSISGQLGGEALVSACGGIPETETVRIRQVNTRGAEQGEFVADTVYGSDDFFPGQRAFGTCKWFYRRVSTEDPQVPSCDPCK